MAERLVFAGAGDIILDRDEPLTALQNVRDILREADVTYINMEQVLCDGGTPKPGHAVSKGTRFVEVYKDAQVDVVSTATNHALDWGTDGLAESLETLDKAGVAHVGTGANLAEARKPAILERKGVKFGFLNYCSVHPSGYEATDTKPGLAPLKVDTIYRPFEEQPGTPPVIITRPTLESEQMITEDVAALKEQVDIVIVIFHWGQHLLDYIIPQYCVEIAHKAMDAGADMIVSSHTHILKGIEVYKGKPIYYSFGNFVEDFGKAFAAGDDNIMIENQNWFYFGQPTKPNADKAAMTIIAKAYIEDGKIVQFGFMPGKIIDHNPTPLKRDEGGQEVVDYMTWITEAAGLNAKFEWINDEEVKVVEA